MSDIEGKTLGLHSTVSSETDDENTRLNNKTHSKKTEKRPQLRKSGYGIAGNIRALQRVHRAVERYWRIMLSSRTWKGQVLWKQFQQIKDRLPLVRPKLYLPYSELQAIAVL